MGVINAKPRVWDRESYYALADSGALRPDERVELIEGEVIPMSPQNPPHANHVMRVSTLLVRAFGDTHFVRVQLPLDLGKFSQPEPDFAVVRQEDVREDAHPSSAVLVLEVADSTLAYDRLEKASLYAKHRIPEFWLLNLRQGWVEVHRGPVEDQTAIFGHSYKERVTYEPGQQLAPLFAQTTVLHVSDLIQRT